MSVRLIGAASSQPCWPQHVVASTSRRSIAHRDRRRDLMSHFAPLTLFACVKDVRIVFSSQRSCGRAVLLHRTNQRIRKPKSLRVGPKGDAPPRDHPNVSLISTLSQPRTHFPPHTPHLPRSLRPLLGFIAPLHSLVLDSLYQITGLRSVRTAEAYKTALNSAHR